MMVIVPSLPEGQQRNPPTVGREVAGGKAAGAPAVRRRVHQPGGVQANHGPDKDAPHQEWKSADRQQPYAQGDNWYVAASRATRTGLRKSLASTFHCLSWALPRSPIARSPTPKAIIGT